MHKQNKSIDLSVSVNNNNNNEKKERKKERKQQQKMKKPNTRFMFICVIKNKEGIFAFMRFLAKFC